MQPFVLNLSIVLNHRSLKSFCLILLLNFYVIIKLLWMILFLVELMQF